MLTKARMATNVGVFESLFSMVGSSVYPVSICKNDGFSKMMSTCSSTRQYNEMRRYIMRNHSPSYCPRKHSSMVMGGIALRTSTLALRMLSPASGPSACSGASMARTDNTCKRWFCTMSRMIPKLSACVGWID